MDVVLLMLCQMFCQQLLRRRSVFTQTAAAASRHRGNSDHLLAFCRRRRHVQSARRRVRIA